MCRRLVDAGVHVAPVLTEDAQRFVGALTFSALASEPARTRCSAAPSPIPHTRLGQHGRPDRRRAGDREADRQVRGRHLRRPAHRDAARDTRAGARLPGDAHRDVGAPGGAGEPRDAAPAAACTCRAPKRAASPAATVGAGRLAEPERIARRVLAPARPRTGRPLGGRTVLVTAGGTREAIDPVRFVGNRSSGKMGHAIADVAARRGARVVLVTTAHRPSPRVSRSCGSRARRRCTTRSWPVPTHADVVVMAAAVADFRPKAVAPQKLKKSRRRARDRARADRRHPRRARPHEARRPGRRRLRGRDRTGARARGREAGGEARRPHGRQRRDAADAGFEVDTNRAVLLDSDGEAAETPLLTKDALAGVVLDRVAALRSAPRT